MATRFPFDYTTLNKGDLIPAERLEGITSLSRDDDKYQLRLLGIQQQIMEEMAAIGRPVTIVVRGKDLIILTDAEASAYNADRLMAHLHGVMRAHERSMAVDAANLTPDQQKEHVRRVEVGGKFTQAILDTGRKLKLPEYKRTTPALPAGG